MFDYQKALNYYNKATLNNTDTNFLSAIYNNMSLCYEKKFQFEKQKEYLQKILTINQHQKDKTRLSECYANLGNYFFTVHKLDSAKFCIEKSIELDKEMGNVFGENYEIYGKILMGMNKDNEAEQAYLKCIKIFREQSIDKLSTPFYGLSDLMRKKKEYIKSLSYMDSASECVIKLYKNDIVTETKKLEKDFNLKLKDEQIKNLDAEKKIAFQRVNNQIKFFVLSLILLGLGFIIYNQRQNKKRLVQDIHSLELEQQLLRSQMNPHFIFNSIAGIRGNILNDEKEKAIHYLSKFSKLTRNILENSSQKAVSIEEDVMVLKNYIDLQLMRFDNSFDVEFSIDKNIDTENSLMPPMLIQPIIENAIEHGFRGLSYRGKLEIVYQLLENNFLEIKIIDNGKGLGKTSHDEVQQMKKQSMSFDITKKRLALWSQKGKRKSSIEINENPTEIGTGVTSVIHVSLKIKNG